MLLFKNWIFSGVVRFALADHYSMILRQDGSVWSTIPTLNNPSRPDEFGKRFAIVIPNGVKALAAGVGHSILLKQDGTVWAAGDNEYGQLGDGSTTLQNSFVHVFPRGAKAIAAGYHHSLILQQDGSVWATGRNNLGQLGGETKTSVKRFVQVLGGGMHVVAAGDWHSVALEHGGNLWATGSNSNGQFGNGFTSSTTVFISVAKFAEIVTHDVVHDPVALDANKVHVDPPIITAPVIGKKRYRSVQLVRCIMFFFYYVHIKRLRCRMLSTYYAGIAALCLLESIFQIFLRHCRLVSA